MRYRKQLTVAAVGQGVTQLGRLDAESEAAVDSAGRGCNESASRFRTFLAEDSWSVRGTLIGQKYRHVVMRTNGNSASGFVPLVCSDTGRDGTLTSIKDQNRLKRIQSKRFLSSSMIPCRLSYFLGKILPLLFSFYSISSVS